ncbi:hypothetical protein [Phytoactinopolyspora halotolerans]|uniref:Uncharacterized protein n=1 Tax=Phytoactinopolyspora halotolerans TaxID=1981512 RepID=A0A6L9S837_9ACTN|nr:hypothetical protein [Phytoactinopolyspora halotolerans]NEE00140.1 hypothetical protein [Phytoactinopolyspora halotolerans]
MHPHIDAAIRNNVEWCDLVCRQHGVETRLGLDAWVALRRSPPLYPDAVTLVEHPSMDEVLRHVDESSGCSIKDSFGTLELSPRGFRPLFDAEWIRREPTAQHHRPDLQWSVVHKPEDLAGWGNAHGNGDVFIEGMLRAPTVAVVVAYDGEAVAAGAIANRSESVVGISNVFTVTAGIDETWSGAVAAISAVFPGLALVGYEAGTHLEAAYRAGFTSIGPLRIWVKD